MARQRRQTLAQMLQEISTACDRGTKCNAQGYKVHLDTADCGLPIAALLSAASMHDSLAAIPLSLISQGRVTNLYDLMDAASQCRVARPQSQPTHAVATSRHVNMEVLKHMTVAEFAQTFGVSPRTVENKISAINRGRADPLELPRFRKVMGRPVFFHVDIEAWDKAGTEPVSRPRRGRPRKRTH